MHFVSSAFTSPRTNLDSRVVRGNDSISIGIWRNRSRWGEKFGNQSHGNGFYFVEYPTIWVRDLLVAHGFIHLVADRSNYHVGAELHGFLQAVVKHSVTTSLEALNTGVV